MKTIQKIEEIQKRFTNLQRELASSESIRHAEKEILIQEIEKHTATKNNLRRALEALKDEHRNAIDSTTAGFCYHLPSGCQICALIFELEEVK